MQETVIGFFFYILYTELKINQSPSPQFQNQSPPPSALCSFLKIDRIEKVVNKHTADYQLSYFYGLLSTFSLQSIFFLNLCILPWLQKILKFIAIRLLQIHFTNLVSSILVTPSSKTLPQDFIIIPQVREELPIPPKQHFLKISFPEREERRKLWSWKNYQNYQRYWSQVLINSTILQPLHFLFMFCCAII